MSLIQTKYHYSVLWREVLEVLSLPFLKGEQGVFIDATLGEGGHSRLFLEKFPQIKMIGLEADRDILLRAEKRLRDFKERSYLIHGWSHSFFEDKVGNEFYEAVLMDLGISTFHYHFSQKGFSFLKDEPLDMRLDEKTQSLKASDIINFKSEKDLADIFYQLGEERQSRLYAKAICRKRDKEFFKTTKQLADILYKISENQNSKRHPATKVFQALRIYVNNELLKLPSLLNNAIQCLSEGGRLAVITFHSLEDRIVKQVFRSFAKSEPSLWRLVNKKVITPSREEIKENPPSRSAKLRVIERLRGVK